MTDVQPLDSARPDRARAEAFADRMVSIIDDSSLALLISVGHHTALFDTMAGSEPSTSAEIAAAAGLDERYVTEWLGGMTVGGIVEFDQERGTYRLPAEHAAVMTSDAGPDDLAFFTRYLALMGSIAPQIVQVFRTGGGLGYDAYPTFVRLQRQETARVFDAALVDTIVPLVPGLAERLSTGIDVIDIGTGAGHAVNVLARAFPRSRFLGVDISVDGIEIGRSEAREWGLHNAAFEVRDAVDLPPVVDLVTAFDTVHDQARPTELLASIAASLAPGGVFLMGDIAMSSELADNIGNTFAPTVFAFSVFHCLTVSLAQGGEGLGAAWGEQRARNMLAAAGFASVDTAQVPGDPLNLYYIARP